MAGDQCIEIAVGIDIRETLLLRECRGGGERYQNRRQCQFAKHGGSVLQILILGEVTALHEEVGQLCGQNHFNPVGSITN
jgi:hypothetical protein